MRTLVALMAFTLLLSANLCAEVKSALKYPQLKGKIVRNIIIKLGDVFDESSSGFIYRQANNFKINTKEYVIFREVLLKEGEEFNEGLMAQSARNIRAFRFLRDVDIHPVEDGGFVDLIVTAKDTWTIIPQVGFSSGTGNNKASIGMVEHNLLGYGKKVGAKYSEEDKRTSLETIYSDYRFLGTKNNFNAGVFNRNDGDIHFFGIETPFRSFDQKEAWSFDAYRGDTIGRLFNNANERYIFRQENININGRYSIASGDPEHEVHRLSFGYDYISDKFQQADQSDYNDLNLDPEEVSNDPSMLADDRIFTGPSLTYHFIEPNYISRNYIDRFDRVDDYNLGTEYSFSSLIAPEAVGSGKDTFLFSANRSGGWKFGNDAFLRGEIGYASRYDDDGASNSLYRGELKYFNVLGPKYIKELYIGKHTFAASIFMDYAEDLDRDRQFLLGGDAVIRGYKTRTFEGDKRMGINIEDRIHLIDDAFQLISLGAAVFLDAGGATYSPVGNIVTEDFYSDVGAGLRIAFPRSTGSQVLRLDISFPMRDGPDGSGQFEPRILLSGGQIFNSKLRSEVLGAERANIDVGFDR